MKKRKIKKPIKCHCSNLTDIQIYDFANNNWVSYCEVCKETINDPNGI